MLSLHADFHPRSSYSCTENFMSNPNVSVIQRVLFTVINSEGMQQCRGLYRFLRTSMTKCEMNPMEYAHDMLTGRVREGTTHDIKETV